MFVVGKIFGNLIPWYKLNVCRTDLEYYRDAERTVANVTKFSDTEASFIVKKTEFEKLRWCDQSELCLNVINQSHCRSDVQIKLKFLDENRVKVMQSQLLLFHNAVASYFSGNQTALEATMKQFSIKVNIWWSHLHINNHMIYRWNLPTVNHQPGINSEIWNLCCWWYFLNLCILFSVSLRAFIYRL